MTQKALLVLMFAVSIFSNIVPIHAQDTTPPKLLSATAVTDMVKTGSSMQSISLSPDGKTVVWFDNNEQQVCLITIADASDKCSPYAKNFGHIGRFSNITWSPDSRYIATNETFFDQFIDSDIWIFDTQTGQFIDRTDDNYFGNAMKLPDTAFADYLPSWNPVTNDLYMFRTPPWMNQTASTGPETNLYKLPIDKGDPTLVQMLAVRLPALSVYRPVSFSPDGKQMAFLVLPNDYVKNPQTGLWVMDLTNTQFKQITNLTDLQAGLPSDIAERKEMIPNTVSWAGNDAVVIGSQDQQATTYILNNSYYVSLKDGKVTALHDYSSIKPEDFFKEPANENDIPLRATVPWAGITKPDGKGYVYVGSDLQSKTGYVWWMPLPPDGKDPVLLGKIADLNESPAKSAEPSISQDGTTVLLYGYVVKLGTG